MKWIILAAALCMLSGCAAEPVWETIGDEPPAEAVSCWQDTACDVELALPADAGLVGQGTDGAFYVAGDLEIETRRFLAADYQTAIHCLSGFRSDRVTILKTEREQLPEYQFAWYAETAEGGRLYRADLVMDDHVCYAVICSMPETGADGETAIRQVLSSFGLSEPV